MKPIELALVLGIVCAHAGIRVSRADPPAAPEPPIVPSSYNAFDLRDRRLTFELTAAAITAIEIEAPGGLACRGTPRPVGADRRRFEVGLDSCGAILQQASPGPLRVKVEARDADGKSRKWEGIIPFDAGIKVDGKASYDSSTRILDLANLRSAIAAPLEVAFYNATIHRWEQMTLDDIHVVLDQRPSGMVFAKLPPRDLLVEIPFGSIHENLMPFECDPYAHHERLKKVYRDLDFQLYCIDQANPLGVPAITLNQHNIVPVNNYQILIVRHWDDVVPELTYHGAGVGLTAPSFVKLDSSGKAEVTSQTGTLQGRSVLERYPGEGYEISAFLLAPHAPGYSHFDLTFASVVAAAGGNSGGPYRGPDDDKAKDASNDKAGKDKSGDGGASAAASAHAIGFDVITDEAYSGALRLGVSHVFSNTHRYTSFTPPGGAQAQIERIDGRPLEIALGYSIYGDIVTGGRTYNISYGTGLARAGYWVLRHTGLYAGVGVLGYDGGKLDYLRSLYFGVELDFNRNISLGFAWNLRRNDLLADAMVGGPVPPSGIQTRSEAQSTCAVILNVTSEFFEFAKGVVKL